MISGRVRAVLVSALFALPAGTEPWDKPPEQWDLADSYKILRDSPWTPSDTKFEANFTQRHTDKLSGLVTDSPTNTADTPLIRGVEVNRNKPLPPVSILWWSSKTVRLAERRLLELKNSPNAAAIPVETLPDYVVAIEGSEPLRIFQDANEDLHETVFLVLDEGLTLDLAQVKFVEATEDTAPAWSFIFRGKWKVIPRSIRNRRKSSFIARLRRKLLALGGKTLCPCGRNFILVPCAPMEYPTCDWKLARYRCDFCRAKSAKYH